MVESITFERHDEYFDIHVPVEEHYLAEGMWHHNSGKTAAALHRLYLLAHKYPGMRGLIVRKTRSSLSESVLVTWEQHVVPEGHPMLTPTSRRMRNVYDVGNGSEIIVGGLDNSQKVMSTEYDVIFVSEAIEVTEEDWENLSSRLRNGKMPYQQLMADTNPSSPTHWLKKRCDAGKTRLIEGRIQDNPRWFDQKTGEPTREGRLYMARLDALTGTRRLRLRDGRWVQAEGVVYEGWDAEKHVVDNFVVPPEWSRYMTIDFGFTVPIAIGFWAEDPEGRLYLYKEIYKTKTLVEDAVKDVRRVWADEYTAVRDFVIERAGGIVTDDVKNQLDELEATLRPRAIICDHDAEDRKTFEKHTGLQTIAAKKAVTAGIQAVAERLKVPDGEKLPRLMVFRDTLAHAPDEALVESKKPTRLAEEIDGYVFEDKAVKDRPVKSNDHAVDGMRYLCAHLSRHTPFYAKVVNV